MSLTLMGHSATQAGALLEFLGRMLGKALYEGILLDLPLAGFFLKKFRTQHCDVRTLPLHASPACSLVSPWVQRSCHHASCCEPTLTTSVPDCASISGNLHSGTFWGSGITWLCGPNMLLLLLGRRMADPASPKTGCQ